VSDVTGTYEAGDGTGPGDNAQATHTESFVALEATILLPGPTILYTAPLVSTAEAETGSASTTAGASVTGSATSTAAGTAVSTGASSGAGRRVRVPWRW
jgi:hypothetical protein